MIESNKCDNCGANVVRRGDGFYCEYCGSTFLAKSGTVNSNQTTKVNMERPTMTDEVLKTVAFAKGSKIAVIPIIVFEIIWCTVCFGMALVMFTDDMAPGAMGVVPLLMGVFGLVMFSVAIKSTLGPRALRVAGKQAEEGDWRGAYSTLQESYSKKIEILVGTALIFISFFKFKDDEKTKAYINDLNHLNYTGNAKVKEIANYLGVQYNRVSYAVHNESVTINNDAAAILGTLGTIAAVSNMNRRYNRPHHPPHGSMHRHHGPGGFGPRPPRF